MTRRRVRASQRRILEALACAVWTLADENGMAVEGELRAIHLALYAIASAHGWDAGRLARRLRRLLEQPPLPGLATAGAAGAAPPGAPESTRGASD
jgi:hypothetical protein